MLEKILTKIIENSDLHSRWLNTLSFLENCGARKIALAENKIQVKEDMLKHAAEEFRHAYFLKKQINKVGKTPINYSKKNLLGAQKTLHYLDSLEVAIMRFLKINSPSGDLKHLCYLLVTYAIEKRASIIYPSYHSLLKQHHSKVSVRSILIEEEEHLKEMDTQLDHYDSLNFFRRMAIYFENEIYCTWLSKLSNEVISC